MPKMSLTDKAVMATLAVSGVGVAMSAAVVRLREARDCTYRMLRFSEAFARAPV